MDQPEPLPMTEPDKRVKRWRAALYASAALLVALAVLGLWRSNHRPPPVQAPPAVVAQPATSAPAPVPKHRLVGERSLSGRVIDDQKKPLEGAAVRVTSLDDPDALPWEARTDAGGRFAFQELVAHAVIVEITAEGHDGVERALRADDAEPLDVVLPRQGELMVVLRDAPGQPVEGAVVTLTGPGLWPAAEATANAAGEALFVKLALGEYRARARREGRVAAPSPKVRVVPGERAQLALTLTQGVALSAKIVDRTRNTPIAEAQVALFDPTPGISPRLATSDAEGLVTLDGLYPATLRLEVSHAGHAPRSLDVSVPSAPITVELDGEVTLSGRVVDEHGDGVEGALLSISTPEGLPLQLALSDSSPLRAGELGVTRGPVPKIPITYSAEPALGTLATQSDGEGKFRIAGVAPTTLLLSAARSGYATNALEIKELVPHSERGDLQLVLRSAGRVEGTVRDARGHPVGSVYVSTRSGGNEQSAISDAAGHFALLDLLGQVTVVAEPQGYPALTCQVRVEAKATARCEFTVGSTLYELPVRVMDDFRFGLEGALVSVNASGDRTYTQVTRRDGSAILRDLPEPPYRVEAALRGFVAGQVEVSEPEREVRITLVRAATLSGLVLDTVGRPVPSAMVTIESGEVTAETDIEGRFTLHGVPPGALAIWAAHRSAGEGKSHEVRARAGETLEGVRIVLPGRYLESTRTEAVASSRAEPPEARVERRTKSSDFELEARGDAVVFSEVLSGSAADRAGVRTGDVLVSIDGEPVLSPAQGRGMLRDPPGFAANLRLKRAGAQLRLRYKRPAL